MVSWFSDYRWRRLRAPAQLICAGLTLLLLSIQMEVLLFSRCHGESLYQRSGDDVVLKMILEADQTDQSGTKGAFLLSILLWKVPHWEA